MACIRKSVSMDSPRVLSTLALLQARACVAIHEVRGITRQVTQEQILAYLQGFRHCLEIIPMIG
jgi:hypothetical protein